MVDGDAAVHRRVRAETPRSLLELPLAADPATALRLVPGDRHVDEALQEVALSLRCGTPGCLELLVGCEPGALAQQHEPGSQVGVHRRTVPGWYRQPVATIKLEGVDLLLRSRLEGLLRDHTLTTAAGAVAELVIADLSRVDAAAVVAAYPGVPVLGYGNHTDTEGLRRAHRAGVAQVVVKSALMERAPLLVGRLIGPVE